MRNFLTPSLPLPKPDAGRRRGLKPEAITALAFTFLFSFFSFSAEAADGFDLKGFLSIDKRFLTEDSDAPIIDFYNDLQVEGRARPGKNVSALASLDVRYYDYPRPADDFPALQDINTPTPVEFSLWEGYIDVTGFLLEDLDFRLGKQRIAWGTADKLNQTDNLNPDDYSDPLDFGRKFPSTAFLATYYLNDWQLIGVWVPSIRPVLLPTSGINLEALMPPNISELPDDVSFKAGSIETRYPALNLKNSMGALKIKGQLFNTDFSISYFHGYDDTPLPTQLSNLAITPTEISADAIMELPSLDIVGLDLAGELFTVGFWAEAALLLPENKMILSGADPASETLLQNFLAEEARTILKESPSFKYTVGGDYTFGNGIYLNCQYMHGFFTEVGVDNLGNYFIARIEKKFFRDKIKTNLSGGLATMALTNGDRFKDTLAYFVAPEFQYLGIDNLEITLGYFALAGKAGTLFGSMTDQDQVFLKAKLSF